MINHDIEHTSVVTDPGIYLLGPLGSIQNSKDPKRPRVSRSKLLEVTTMEHYQKDNIFKLIWDNHVHFCDLLAIFRHPVDPQTVGHLAFFVLGL
jgi:hypothetical protein